MNTYVLDSAPENTVPAMGLMCESAQTIPHWNGWGAPIATFDELAAFILRWANNDPNGEWFAPVVLPSDSGFVLYVPRAELGEGDTFPMVDMTPHGRPLFDLSGWAWVQLTETEITE